MTLEEKIKDAFQHHVPDAAQLDAMIEVRESLEAAAQTLARVVPESPMRTRALNAVIDARMLANAAIVLPIETQQLR